MGLRSRRYLRLALLLYGALNASLYANLLPLWDGFDEAFHYSFIQALSQRLELPVLGETHISYEVRRSLELAPVSHIMKRNIPYTTAFADYFQLSNSERTARRQLLSELNLQNQAVEGSGLNYEAQQAPLSYGLLAICNVAWKSNPLLQRVLRLRLIGALLAVWSVWALMLTFGKLLNIPEAFLLLAIFLAFSTQMLYATVAHVCNDWLALPIFSLIIVSAIRHWEVGSWRTASLFCLSDCIGLITKASFLAIVPFWLAVIILSRFKHSWNRWSSALMVVSTLTVPALWYARNVRLYGNLSGMQELRGGVSTGELTQSVWLLPWLDSFLATSKAAMWTGNNSATTFSSRTISGALILVAIAACLYVFRAIRNGLGAADTIVLGALTSYGTGLVYSVIITFWSTNGTAIVIPPWYVQMVFPPMFCVLSLGLARSGNPGRYIGLLMTWMWSYIILATYLVKLIPFYSGYTAGNAHFVDLVAHYTNSYAKMREILDHTVLGNGDVIVWLTAGVALFAIGIAILLSYALIDRAGLRAPTGSAESATSGELHVK